MKQACFFLFLLLNIQLLIAQSKKPLDHTVYDGWKSLGERMISNDGAYVVYTVVPQEGDGELVIQNPETKYKKVVPRGYNAVITEDSKYLIFKIKPFFQDTRQARIKKKKADETPKDTLAIIELGKDSIIKKSRIKNYKTPEKGLGILAYQLEKPLPDSTKKKATTDSARTKNDQLVKLADSLIKKSIDSIKGNISKEELTTIVNKAVTQIIKEGKDSPADAEGDETGSSSTSEGTDLVLLNLDDNKEKVFRLVNEFYFDKTGKNLLMETTKKSKDSNSSAMILIYHLQSHRTDTVMTKFNDAKSYVFDESGNQLAFIAERDSSEKSLQKFYRLWYFGAGMDTAKIVADRNTTGMQLGYTVSDNSRPEFSKDGTKLYFGSTIIRAPKDTNLVEFETARLDVWNYKDDYLQPQQLRNADAELKRSYLTVYHLKDNQIVQLGSADAEQVTTVNEGNADWVLAETNKGNRLEGQWTGRTKSTSFVINTKTGERKTVFSNLYANAESSPGGKFVYWYNAELKNYFTYEIATGITKNVTGKIKTVLYDEDNDVPDLPSSYGVMGWQENDAAMFIYDRYDVWKVAPLANEGPSVITLLSNPAKGKSEPGRNRKQVERFVNIEKEHRFFVPGKKYFFSVFNDSTKESAIYMRQIDEPGKYDRVIFNGASFASRYTVSDKRNSFIYSKETFESSPNFYFADLTERSAVSIFNSAGEITGKSYDGSLQLSDINPQQKEYNWGTAELFKWKAYNGKYTNGIVYKPEDFDPKKKYPLICYFYETLSDGLYGYIPPAPTPSRLNISFFVSRGYIVLAPDIHYTTGHPGNDAYNHIASGARALVKLGFIDSTKIGIQGQSWGGYQVAYLITKTKLFSAAWAGAPVANMTSAYGGIRWESGLNRQFQYERTQSRIGATLWEKPQLYIENSPLFHLPKVQTPLAIMSNDADGAVPWYQGIELFTALRRLGKPVWLLNYNGEAHNLVERRNRKDIQIREQQFFDWLLKGEKPPRWITDGVPATEKGKDWGLKTD